MSSPIGLLQFITAVITFAGMIGFVMLVSTSPGWFAGHVHWRPDRRPQANFINETRWRRGFFWFAGGLIAFAGTIVFAGNALLGAAVVAAGWLLSSYVAFHIGWAAKDRKKAHRKAHLYAALPEGLGPQHEVEVGPLSSGEFSASDDSFNSVPSRYNN